MFLQLAHSLEQGEDMLEIEKTIKLSDICDYIEILNDYFTGIENYPQDYLLELSKYLESNLKANFLFEFFLSANTKVQKEIFEFIGHIFNEEKTVESLLDKYNITLKESAKQFVKKYS